MIVSIEVRDCAFEEKVSGSSLHVSLPEVMVALEREARQEFSLLLIGFYHATLSDAPLSWNHVGISTPDSTLLPERDLQ